MNRNRQISISSQRVRAILRVLFVVFSFLYFYRFQTPLLALVQHQLSEGQTTYTPCISAAVLTFVLLLVQRLVSRWIHFTESTYCFSYLPSAILAVLLTAFTPVVNTTILLILGVAFLCFIGVAFYVTKNKTVDDHSATSFFNLFGIQGTGMLGIFLFIGGLSHSNDVLTYELDTARSLNEMNSFRALHIGNKSLATSNRLTALRAYALSQRQCGIGDSLFTFPLPGTGAEMLMFAPNDTLNQLLPPDSLYANLGVWPSDKETPIRYFERMKTRSGSPKAKEYWLGALLLEKDLNRFADEISHYYSVADSVDLPTHYKEALTLYNLDARKPVTFMGDSVVRVCYEKFVEEGAEYSDSIIRKNQLHRKYGDTYWWYYHYQN